MKKGEVTQVTIVSVVAKLLVALANGATEAVLTCGPSFMVRWGDNSGTYTVTVIKETEE